MWRLEELGVIQALSRHQHAFRKRHSTETILSDVVDLIEQNILRKRHTLGVFFDIEGAFDNVLLEKAIESMRAKSVPVDITSWYAFYLRNRTARLDLGDSHRERFLTRGTPQGGILSPLVWNLVFDGLLGELGEIPGVHPRGYADDGMFLISGICPDTLVDLAQPAIDTATAWGERNGLKFSKEKTKVVLFTRRHKPGIPRKLKIYGNELPYVTSVEYLGLTLTDRLRWDQHIKTKINRARIKLFQLRTATGVIWGPSPKVMVWVYRTIIIPALTYGSMVWGHTKFPLAIKNKLARLNRLASSSLAPIRRSTPTQGLQVILGLKPLEVIIQETGLSSYRRWNPILKWPGKGRSDNAVGHILAWVRMAEPIGLNQSTMNHKTMVYNWEPPCVIESVDQTKETDFLCLIHTSRVDGETHFSFKMGKNGEEGWHQDHLRAIGGEQCCLYRGFEEILKTLALRLGASILGRYPEWAPSRPADQAFYH